MGKIKEADEMYVPFVLDLDLWKRAKGNQLVNVLPLWGGGGVGGGQAQWPPQGTEEACGDSVGGQRQRRGQDH